MIYPDTQQASNNVQPGTLSETNPIKGLPYKGEADQSRRQRGQVGLSVSSAPNWPFDLTRPPSTKFSPLRHGAWPFQPCSVGPRVTELQGFLT